jgi:hypothetical protein
VKNEGGASAMDEGVLRCSKAETTRDTKVQPRTAFNPDISKQRLEFSSGNFLISVLVVLCKARSAPLTGIAPELKIIEAIFCAPSALDLRFSLNFHAPTGMLYVLSFLPLGLMVFWLIRVQVSKAFKGRAAHRAYVGRA